MTNEKLNAQSNSLTYGNVPSTVAPGGSFTFSVNLVFVSGGLEANVKGLSLWFYQMNPSSGPFTLSFTDRDNTGSFFGNVQTDNTDLFGDPTDPMNNPPRNMPLSPINNQGAGSPYLLTERTDLGAVANTQRASGTYFIANITLSTAANTAPGTYTISNTTAATTNVGGRISVTNSSTGQQTFAIDQSTFSFTVIPEPSTYALMAVGAVALGMVAYRRRAVS
ncbi:MAG: PEP-CTERM sorting domain-containing protein [Chthoniobacterales bacterium]